MLILITEHICERYIERFNQNLASIGDKNQRIARAKEALNAIMQSAHYVSDDQRGILLHSKTHNCNLIVRNRKLITIYIPNPKIKSREKKHANNGGYNRSAVSGC